MLDGHWNHSLCGPCLALLCQPAPIRIRPGDPETCCFCGDRTFAGFYVSMDPKLTPCQGGAGPAALLPQHGAGR